MSFELQAHTADIGISADGNDLEEVFEQIAEGLAAAMLDTIPADGERYPIAVCAESREALLFDYLDELIYQRDVLAVLPVDHDVSVDTRDGMWQLEGSFRGVPARGLGGREIKAVTYADMRLEATEDGWIAYVVFDV